MKFYNNLLTESELEFVNKTLSGDHWGFGYISTDSNKPIWNFDKQLAKPVAELITSKLDGFVLDDWHINGQTIGLSGSPHTDSYSNCSHAFVFFFQEWDYTWGGRLHVFKEHPIVITPQKNFGVLFESNLLHYAEAPVVPILRISIGLKLNVKRT
jgi:hypothetical protein